MVRSDDQLVSVIIPTYYRNNWLPEAIESALHQEYSPVEVVVVDDSGEANAEPVVTEYDDVKYVPLERNVGGNPAREAGLEVSSGRYVQFLDDDDLLREDKLSRQVDRFDDSTGVVYSGLEYLDSCEVILPDPNVRGDVLKRALEFQMWPPCYTSSLLIDRSVLDEIRPLRYHGAGDTGFVIGLARRTHFEFVDEPLVKKRLHDEGLGFSIENVRHKRMLLAEYEDLYEKHPRCRRAALEHTYVHEGSIRTNKSRWNQVAAVSFARAARHAPNNIKAGRYTGYALGVFFGAVGVRIGGHAGEHLSRFVTICWNDGVREGVRKTVQYVRAN